MDIKKPRVQSPISDDFEDLEEDIEDVDEKTNVQVKGPKKKVKELYI